MRPNKSDLPRLYGHIADGRWPDESKHMTLFHPVHELPFFPRRIYCNVDLAEPLEEAMKNVVTRGLAAQIKSFDGCFNIRNSRGLQSISNHAYGLALDINADTNKLGTKGDISIELVRCFTDAGFIWGGVWHRPDPMHFQYVTEA